MKVANFIMCSAVAMTWCAVFMAFKFSGSQIFTLSSAIFVSCLSIGLFVEYIHFIFKGKR